jgi:predicted outer membrane repeat protein
VKLTCAPEGAALVPLVPRAGPRISWDSLGGGEPRVGAPGVTPSTDSAAGALLPDVCVLDGGDMTRILVLPPTAPANLRVNISGLVLRNGLAEGDTTDAAASGGALTIQSSSALVLVDHCTFDGNSAEADGGAIVVTRNSALIALGVRFTDNVRRVALHIQCTGLTRMQLMH